MELAVINHDCFYRFCSTVVEQVGWYHNKSVTSFGFKKRDDGWLLSIKASGIGHGQIVFFACDTISLCIQLFYVFCRHPPSSGVKWVMAKW